MTNKQQVRRVAVVGLGPAGVASVHALAQEQAFDVIRVFERRHEPGGCWSEDAGPPPRIKDLASLGTRTADGPARIPASLPAYTLRSVENRFDEATVYPYLETNVDHRAMMFESHSIPGDTSELSVSKYGPMTPFRHWSIIKRYLQDIVDGSNYGDMVTYNTTVELVEKVDGEWRVVVRKAGKVRDYWWEERFDAVIVANGHYNVPYIPTIKGLQEWEDTQPGSILHSKHFRGREDYKNKRVVVVGKSVSAGDIAFDLVGVAKSPVHAITVGHNANRYFGDEAFHHPGITNHPSIEHVDIATRTVYLNNGETITGVDHIIFGTGYTWTLPFLSSTLQVRNNRIQDVYLHIIWRHDSTLLFTGAVQAGLTFKIFEWQAVFCARLLAGRSRPLPSVEAMKDWEEKRIKARGNGPKFDLIFPDFEEYFETLRHLAGPGLGEGGVGRRLPEFQREWVEIFMAGHELRKEHWRRVNMASRALSQKGEPRTRL